MKLNQDYGAWKSASLAVHVKISNREKLTESTCVTDCVNKQHSSLRRDIPDLRRSLTHPVSAAQIWWSVRSGAQWLLICVRMKRKIKGLGIPIFEQSLPLFLHLFCRDSAGDLVTIQKQACVKFLTGNKIKKKRKESGYFSGLQSALCAFSKVETGTSERFAVLY